VSATPGPPRQRAGAPRPGSPSATGPVLAGSARRVPRYLRDRLGDQFRDDADCTGQEPLDGDGVRAGIHVDVRGPLSGLVAGEHGQREQHHTLTSTSWPVSRLM
jgi:hypothetical protein